MNINIHNLLLAIEKYGFTSSDQHWLLPPASNVSKEVHKIIQLPQRAFRLKRKSSCPHSNCINPDCFNLLHTSKTSNFVDEEDFLDAVEDVNLDDVHFYGPRKYLKIYNSKKSEIFKLTFSQLIEIIQYKENQK